MNAKAALLLVILSLNACDRRKDGAEETRPDAGAARAEGSAKVEASASAAAPEPPRPASSAPAGPADVVPPASHAQPETQRNPASPVEAARLRLRRVGEEKALAPHEGAIAAHFNGKLPSPLDVQTVRLAGDRRLYLIQGAPEDRNPFILAIDPDGKVAWTKEHPLAGIRAGVLDMAITQGPEGRVGLAWFDRPSRTVALRFWDGDGNIFADFQLFEASDCDAVGAMHWPGQGVVVAASQHGQARVQLLDANGRLVWGKDGESLPWASRPEAKVEMALDTDDSLLLFQIGYVKDLQATKMPDHLFAARYDAKWSSLWPRSIDFGAIPGAAGEARVALARPGEGKVRATVTRGGAKMVVEVNSAGGVTKDPK